MHNPEQKIAHIDTLCRETRILPATTVDCEVDILPIADTLTAGGLTVLEIVLRTTYGLTAIRRPSEERPHLHIGTGTVFDPQTFTATEKAGASSVVTPGCTNELLCFTLDSEVPLLPDVANASEIIFTYHHGYRRFKLFPVEASGGPAALKVFSKSFLDIRFYPIGGVSLNSPADYLAVPGVMCVGGAWVLSRTVANRSDWAQVERLSRKALEHFVKYHRH